MRVLVSTWAGRTQVSPPSGQISGCHWEFTWCSSGSWILEKDVGGPAALEFTLRGGEGERLLFRWALAEMGSGNAGEALGTGPGLEWIASTFSLLCSPPSLCRFCRTFPWIHSLSLHKSHLCFQWLSEHVYSIHSYLKSIPFVSEYIQDEDFWVISMSLWFEEYKKKKYSDSFWGVLDFDTDQSHSIVIDNRSNPPFDRVCCIAINSRQPLLCESHSVISTSQNGSSL